MTVHALGDLVPVLGRGAWVAPTATVIGDVVLGDDASVWFGVVARGDVYPIRIGARTNVQDNTVVHVTADRSAATIGDDVTIGHSAIIHGCSVGDRCLVGMGSILLDDAVIEEECFVAAGSLVPPRMRVPARSFVVGRPARVIRRVRDGELEQIREAAAHYVQIARRFAAQLKDASSLAVVKT